ncbi:hypothetical protein LZL87_011113 [Fusarium oxysporum]|nr:hypothetical protein LZL87_011113 [Fusarium oxysporum]
MPNQQSILSTMFSFGGFVEPDPASGDIQNFGNTEKKIPGVGEELFAVQTPAKAPLLLGYLEQSEHYIESKLDASSQNSSALYDASKDPSMIQDPTLS